jgi:hypothetical protein
MPGGVPQQQFGRFQQSDPDKRGYDTSLAGLSIPPRESKLRPCFARLGSFLAFCAITTVQIEHADIAAA